MDIEATQVPMAGDSFNFSVDGGLGSRNIKVFVDLNQIYEQDCDDPPCHEMVMIPPGTRGATLRIIATDSIGNKKEFTSQVGDSGSGASGTMEMGG